MPQPEDASHRYQVHCSAAVAKVLRGLQRQASRAGAGEKVHVAFRQIVSQLQADAAEVGEPLYRLPVLGIQVRSVVVRPLVVHFGVCEDRPLVFIKGARLLSGVDRQTDD
jgi:hypothetical protein